LGVIDDTLVPTRGSASGPQVEPPAGGLSEDARRNRAAWNTDADDYQARHGRQLAADGMAWGTWNLPSRSCACSARSPAATSWSWAAAPPRGRSTWPESAPGRSVSTRPRGSSATPAGWSETPGVQVRLVQAGAEAIPLADASFDPQRCAL